MLSIDRARLLCALSPLLLAACHTVHVGNEDGGGDPPADGGAPPADGGSGEACGPVTCDPGLVCCNASCGICTAPGEGCVAIACERECANNGECGADEYCALPEGECPTFCALPEGCPDLPRRGVCAPKPEACPPVIHEVCGCDGATYSSGCDAAAQGVDVARDGACEPPPPRCEAQDARGEGECAAIIGVRWNGERCEMMGGCGCVGSDCGETYGLDGMLECERDHAGCASCEAQDAAGSGPCDAVIGTVWNGEACVSLSGCECVGADCPGLYREPGTCEAAHAHCTPGGSCLSDADCDEGQWCRFALGECGGSGDGLGTCEPPSPPGWACDLDGPPVCGCDGNTYDCEEMAHSMGVSVLHEGACPDGGVCAAMDARGVGSCEPVRGYTWTGSRCEIVGGCDCEGADCDRLYADLSSCRSAHEGCDRPPGGLCGGIAGEICRPDEWCDFEDPHVCGGDDQQGQCRTRPSGCPDVVEPVCACDGGEYGNACEAHAAGWDDAGSLGPGGACDAPAP